MGSKYINFFNTIEEYLRLKPSYEAFPLTFRTPLSSWSRGLIYFYPHSQHISSLMNFRMKAATRDIAPKPIQIPLKKLN